MDVYAPTPSPGHVKHAKFRYFLPRREIRRAYALRRLPRGIQTTRRGRSRYSFRVFNLLFFFFLFSFFLSFFLSSRFQTSDPPETLVDVRDFLER